MRAIIFLIIIFSALGCHKQANEKQQLVVCRSFEFSLEQSDWGVARKQMHSVAIDAGLAFSDESDSPGDLIAILNARIISNKSGVQYILSASTYDNRSATKAKVSFSAKDALYCKADINNDSTYPHHKLYEEIRNNFLKDWEITDVDAVKAIEN